MNRVVLAAKQDQDLIPVTVGLIADGETMSQGYGLPALQGGCQGAGMSWDPHRAVEPGKGLARSRHVRILEKRLLP